MTMLKGIDVSRWQGEIDWHAVRKEGCDFAFIKVTEGATWTDPNFEKNRAGAAAAEVTAGFYHFFRATSKVDAQVEHFISTLGTLRSGELVPVLDVEDPKQWKGLAKSELTDPQKLAGPGE